MNIAYILYPEAMVFSRANGIRNQALTWRKALLDKASVDLLNPWDAIDWEKYDIVHFFGGDRWFNWLPMISSHRPKLIFSPVLDSTASTSKLRFLSSLGFKGYHHPQNEYRRDIRNFDTIFVRSDYEARYFTQSYKIEPGRVVKVPLACELSTTEATAAQLPRESFALNLSLLTQPRKNVERLIMASKRYGFKLKLGGLTGDRNDTRRLLDTIAGDPNIELLGFLDHHLMLDYSRRCGVFVLPSLNEGVGLVALNAAATGAPVVITSAGAPKEYYIDAEGHPLASIVDPLDVDAIGEAVCRKLAAPAPDLRLQQHILDNYSHERVSDLLLDSYKLICGNA